LYHHSPKTREELAERKASSLEMVDWYLAKKSLSFFQPKKQEEQ